MLGIYLKILALFYLNGAVVHGANLLGYGPPRPAGLRGLWIGADVYFLLLDLAAAVGLWLGRPWGVALFLLAAASQLVMYLGFPHLFAVDGAQRGALLQLVAFHVATVALWAALATRATAGAAA